VVTELDLGAALQPHALDRRDRQLSNGDRQPSTPPASDGNRW
jgi:hypothetical protein